MTEISESDSSKQVEETWTPNTSTPQPSLSQVNTIACADEGLWIFSLEDSKKRRYTVNWEDHCCNKTEEHELMIDSGCFGHVCPPWCAPQFPMVSSTSDTAGTWAGASELAVEQARAASSPWADQPAPGPTAQSASGTWAFGVKSLSALALCHKARTLCHRNRFAALEKEEDADGSRELPSNEDFPLVGSHMLASCQHCWEPSCGKKAVAGFEPRPRPKRRETHWTKFADTDVGEDFWCASAVEAKPGGPHFAG